MIMSELTQSPDERFGGNPNDWSDPFAPDANSNSVRVGSAATHDEWLPVAGMSVGEVRRRLADRLNIDPQGQAIVNGQPVGDDVVVQAGVALFFQRAAGEKGLRIAARCRLFWPAAHFVAP
jgi:hypothetical protein